MIFRNKKKINEYWQKLMESTNKKMSEGAQLISKVISWPRGDSWRRNDKVQRGHDKKK